MTGKRTTQGDSGTPVAATEEQSKPDAPVVDLRQLYAEAIKQMELLNAMAVAQGISLGEAPPPVTATRAADSNEWVPTGAGGPNENNTSDIPWGKADLNPKDKYSFVPQFVPTIVHPLLDAQRKPRIFLHVNGMTCCLTVGILNENISGSFYWAYMNAEQQYKESDEYRDKGPDNAPWSSQGVGGTSSWHHEPVAPNAWIDLDGRYYVAGATMPDVTGSD